MLPVYIALVPICGCLEEQVKVNTPLENDTGLNVKYCPKEAIPLVAVVVKSMPPVIVKLSCGFAGA